MPKIETKGKMQAVCDFMNEQNAHRREWFESNGYKLIGMDEPSSILIRQALIPDYEDGGRIWGWVIEDNFFGFRIPEENVEAAYIAMKAAGWDHFVGEKYDYWRPPKEARINQLQNSIDGIRAEN